MSAREPGIRSFMRTPRTALPTLAVFVTLVLSFAIPPFSSVVAAGSSSGSMSSQSSSPPSLNCNASYSAGTVHPGDTVSGTLALSNGCRYSGAVSVSLNGKGLNKNADSNGNVSVATAATSCSRNQLTVAITGPGVG